MWLWHKPKFIDFKLFNKAYNGQKIENPKILVKKNEKAIIIQRASLNLFIHHPAFINLFSVSQPTFEMKIYLVHFS